jgi:two-component system C4-dicarboxylate transport sensor histidine kinase DctB
VQLVPSDTDPGVILVASPIRRSQQFTGTLLGVIDLAAARAIDTGFGRRTGVDVALSTREGRLLIPAKRSADAALVSVAESSSRSGAPFLVTTTSGASPLVVAGSPVPRTGFVLLSATRADALYGPVTNRLVFRLGAGLLLLILPLIGISVVLRGSLRRFRVSEEDAVARERMRSLGEAASLIAHEVRNSLNSLRLGLDVILSGEGSPGSGSGPGNAAPGNGRRAEILRSLRGEMTRLADFTTDLLTFSRGVTPSLASLDLSSFVAKVVESMRARAVDRHVTIDVMPPSGPIMVKADPTLIHVVLTNIVANALEFAGHQQAPRVAIETAVHDRVATVRVIDNGAGVAPAIRPRLFEPFVTGRTNGVGIGLALSRRIARAHGGDLRLVDDPRGTCFELTLPGATE